MSNVMLALPSKGAIADPTLKFLKDCGLSVQKPNPRQYTGTMKALPGVQVLFQRVKDVAYKVADGTAQIGVTGLDVVHEFPHDDLIVIHDALGYGHCELVVAVPESWADVANMTDLADVAAEFRENKGRNLRVATTYTNQTRQFLHRHGIHHFELVRAEGAIEVAPTIGYADIIVDLTQTGTTLRENHLRPLPDGTIIASQACLIGNRPALHDNPDLLAVVRTMLEYMDAAMLGRQYRQVIVNIEGDDAETVAERVAQNPATRGLQGPTIAPIYGTAGHGKHWYTVTLILPSRNLLPAIEYLRGIGASQITTTPVDYVFMDESRSYTQFVNRL